VGELFQEAAEHVLAHNPALAAGVDIVAVRDNLRHATIATTSTYLHDEEAKRARQISEAVRRQPPRQLRREDTFRPIRQSSVGSGASPEVLGKPERDRMGQHRRERIIVKAAGSP
jgi:beta-glucosidase-like glycosyl hydrolase